MSDVILFSHPTFGVLGILAAVWVIAETINANTANQTRIRYAALAVTVCMLLAWLLGGYWYTVYYAPEKALILKGPWPWAHDFVMETKEHLFFIPLILALFLPIAAAANSRSQPRRGDGRDHRRHFHCPQWPRDRRRGRNYQLRREGRLRAHRRSRSRTMSATFERNAEATIRIGEPVAGRQALLDTRVGGAVTGFGLAAAITIVFNTLLAWTKDSFPPLNTLMAHMTGHHWRTHGLVDVILFLVLGFVLTRINVSIDGYRLAAILAAAVIVAGGGLAFWFVLV